MGRNTAQSQNEDTAKKRSFCLRLRQDGYSYEQIGKLLGTQFRNQKRPGEGFTAMYAHRLVGEAIKATYRDDAIAVAKLESERLDAMTTEVLNVLRTNHYVVSAGQIMRDYVRDEDGNIKVDAQGNAIYAAVLDDGPRLQAIDRLLKIQERRARLLGLDKPTKVASTDVDGKKTAPWVIVATPEDQAL